AAAPARRRRRAVQGDGPLACSDPRRPHPAGASRRRHARDRRQPPGRGRRRPGVLLLRAQPGRRARREPVDPLPRRRCRAGPGPARPPPRPRPRPHHRRARGRDRGRAGRAGRARRAPLRGADRRHEPGPLAGRTRPLGLREDRQRDGPPRCVRGGGGLRGGDPLRRGRGPRLPAARRRLGDRGAAASARRAPQPRDDARAAAPARTPRVGRGVARDPPSGRAAAALDPRPRALDGPALARRPRRAPTR
ncbi:MAG: hypothetical protein AVDCRST_MAG30-3262, partial [uncultured Solirubrobacteraceae bacterium]